MIKEAIGVGETLEEATEIAKTELNVTYEDEVQIEVLAEPKKKTFGLFGGSPAKVRVYIEVPDPAPKKKSQKPQKKNDRPARKTQTEKRNSAAAEQAQPEEPAVPASEIPADSPAGRAVRYLSTILDKLGAENVEISVSAIERGARIIITGENLSIVIGRRGETLDALQYLCSLAANSGDGFFRISLDTGNYREKREQALKNLARRISSQVLRTGRSRKLEPMNPYERRIIHTEVQLIDGVESNSVGEGMGRCVVISPVGGARHDNRRSRPGQGREQRNFAPAAPDRAPKKDSDLPLYGKID